MARYTVEAWDGKDLFVGTDMHLDCHTRFISL